MLCSVFEGFMNKLMSGSWAFGNDELLREESDAVDGLVENSCQGASQPYGAIDVCQ